MMMMRNDPTITAPISRSKRRIRHRDIRILSPSVIVVSAMAIATIIMSFLLARTVIMLSSNNDSSGSSTADKQESLLITDEEGWFGIATSNYHYERESSNK